MNRRTKFDVAIFILAGEICNRTNTQTNKQVLPSSGTVVYPHMPILRPQTARDYGTSSHLQLYFLVGG